MDSRLAEQRALGAIGLARRAGKCIAGDYAVERAAKGGKAKAVLLDASASAATRGRYQRLCERNGIACYEVAGLGPAIGKPGNKIAAILDDNFATMLQKALEAPGGSLNQ